MTVAIEILQGDITSTICEAIVNAANNHLWMGSGVAGAIKRKGGEEIEKEAMAQGPIAVGQAIATGAGKLPYKYIIHAAGMGQDLRTDVETVYKVTRNSLLLADRLGIGSVAFPAIGTGVGGLEAAACAEAMIKAVKETSEELKSLARVAFVLFDREAFQAFRAEAELQD
ncbi:MAG: macro domain-containing protein [bacterium]|jgi:O-acetyl-ADP-ribose deacetylase (regulator of RNase III)